jgi:hypothetical protein
MQLTILWVFDVEPDLPLLNNRTLVSGLSSGSFCSPSRLQPTAILLPISSRSCSDWHRLLEICGLIGTLLIDEDGCYDPADFNDQLLLGLVKPPSVFPAVLAFRLA